MLLLFTLCFDDCNCDTCLECCSRARSIFRSSPGSCGTSLIYTCWRLASNANSVFAICTVLVSLTATLSNDSQCNRQCSTGNECNSPSENGPTKSISLPNYSLGERGICRPTTATQSVHPFVCLSVCTTHSSTVSKWLNIGQTLCV